MSTHVRSSIKWIAIKFWLFFITSGLLIPAYSRIHVDKEWIEDHIPITSRYVQFIVVNENILKKRSLLAVSSSFSETLRKTALVRITFDNEL